MGRKHIDLTGQEINGIKVISLVDEKGGAGKHKKWNCVCPVCGKEFIVASQHLRDKNKPIAMCFECGIHQYNDLVGKRFNKLTVISRVENSNGGRVVYKCQCDCGAIVNVQANHLVSGEIQSCGCIVSKGEDMIAKYLSDKKIEFEKQKTFSDCKYKRLLKFDFYIPSINTAIEYQGIQHFEPVEYFGGENEYQVRKTCDNIKEEYCKDNNVALYFINYNENIESKLNCLLQN